MTSRLAMLAVGTLLLGACQTGSSEPPPAAVAPEFVPLFDGATFEGWEGDTQRTWRIEDGALVGGSLQARVPRNEFLATTREYADFVLRLQFRLLGNEGFVNAGVQVRSQRVPSHHEMVGYQLDIGDPSWWGSLYDESRRNIVLAQSDMTALNPVLRRNDWNDYEIHCEGRRVRAFINGVQTVDYTEPDQTLPQSGRIGLQIHGGGTAEAWYRAIEIREHVERKQ